MARAMAHQALHLEEAAMKDWIEVGNFNLAHQILMRNIAPVYFSGQVLDLEQGPLQKLMANKESLVMVLTKLQSSG
jgi:hypothetical protein